MESPNETEEHDDEQVRRAPDGSVFVYATDPDSFADEHERATHFAVAKKLARLKEFRFAGMYDPAAARSSPVYFVPNDTLIRGERTGALGISGEQDLFGGLAPYPFVPTKAITHSLVSAHAQAPFGWSTRFNTLTRDAVHEGFTVFTAGDARRAAADLLAHGPVRAKPVLATGGRGQSIVSDLSDLDPLLERIDPDELSTFGLVLEENLTEVTTHSIGQVQVAGLIVTYCGTQYLTRDNMGETAYGGSDLLVLRGGFGDLLELDHPPVVRLAITQAQTYDKAAMDSFPGLIASRRNYDVAQGRDHRGQWKSGVLEQSWRIGGASTAEIAALEAFRDDPTLKSVRASSVETYGEAGDLPPQSIIYFSGIDNRVGPITKYAVVTAYDRGQESH